MLCWSKMYIHTSIQMSTCMYINICICMNKQSEFCKQFMSNLYGTLHGTRKLFGIY